MEWLVAGPVAIAAACVTLAWRAERRDARRHGLDPTAPGWRAQLRRIRIQQGLDRRESRRRRRGFWG